MRAAIEGRRRVRLTATAWILLVLGACGGGADSGPIAQVPAPGPIAQQPAPTPAPTSAPIPGAVSLPEYLATRPAPAPTPTLDEAQRQQLLLLSAQRNVEVLLRSMTASPLISETAAAVPSVLAAHVELLRQAAAGDTLAQIDAQMPAVADAAVATALTAPLARSMWVQTGFQPLRSFWSATDDSAPARPLRAWQAHGADMSNGGSFADELTGAISAYPATRVAVHDSFSDLSSWPQAVPFAGVFVGDSGARHVVSLIRLKAGVSFYRGGNFRADLIRQGTRTLFQIRPDPEDTKLADFVRNGSLLRAMRELGEAFPMGAPAQPMLQGEMLLPLMARTHRAQLSPAVLAAIPLAYDEINANLRRLDGLGGTYAIAGESTPQIDITSSGVSMQAGMLTWLRFSPRNVNGPGGDLYGVVGTFSQLFFCPHSRAPDLRSFILAQLDERNGWLWSVTVPVAGTACIDLLISTPGPG